MMRVGMEEETAKYYTFVHNLQGEILGLLDRDQDLVVEYRCDPWGKVLDTICGQGYGAEDRAEYEELAQLNPFRYRGYLYDEDTGLYYLRTRYYNPAWGRFVNEDSLLDAGGLFAHNMFAYCGNSPIVCSDPSGQLVVTAGFSIGAYLGYCAIAALVVGGGMAIYNHQSSISIPMPDGRVGSRASTRERDEAKTDPQVIAQENTDEKRNLGEYYVAMVIGTNAPPKKILGPLTYDQAYAFVSTNIRKSELSMQVLIEGWAADIGIEIPLERTLNPFGILTKNRIDAEFLALAVGGDATHIDEHTDHKKKLIVQCAGAPMLRHFHFTPAVTNTNWHIWYEFG